MDYPIVLFSHVVNIFKNYVNYSGKNNILFKDGGGGGGGVMY